MSIGLAGLHLLLPALRSVAATPEARLLFLGTQDLTFTYEQAVNFLGTQGIEIQEVPPSERRTTNSFAFVSHEDWWQYKDFLHQETLLRMLGFGPNQSSTLDMDDYEHASIIHDLNFPILDYIGTFDLILNQGTLEHIFDVRQALWNLSQLTREGGQIVHMVPAGFLNHGFYNFNACLFSDFYGQSGWKQEDLFYTLTPRLAGSDEMYGKIVPEALHTIPEGFDLEIFARYRKSANTTAPIVTQGVYVGLHEAWNHQTREQSLQSAPEGSRSSRRGLFQITMDRLHKRQALKRLQRLGATIVAPVRRTDA